MLKTIKNRIKMIRYSKVNNDDVDIENQLELKDMQKSTKFKNDFDLNKSASFFSFTKYILLKSNIFYTPIFITIISLLIDILNGYFLAKFNKDVPSLLCLIMFGLLRMTKVPFVEYFVKKQQIEDRCNIHVELYRFIREKQANIKYIDRCKTDKIKLNKLTSRMDNNMQYIGTWAFSNFIGLYSGILFTTILFYKNGFTIFGSILYTGFLLNLKLFAYPLIKKHNEKRKTEFKKERDELESKIQIMEFGYESFPENIEKYNQVLKIRKELNLLYEKIYRLPYGVLLSLQWVGELILFLYLIWYHEGMDIKNGTNYFLLTSTSIQLFNEFSNFMYTLSQIEKILADYDEFNDFFEKLEFNEKKVESPIFPDYYSQDINYCIYDNYYLKGNLSFKLGESIIFTGERGCGKTTLSKYIAGYLYKEESEALEINYRERVLYIDQDMDRKWNNNKMQWKDCFENKSFEEIKRILKRFAFPVDKIFNETSTIDDIVPFTLSGGEKKSLQYAVYFNSPIYGVQNITQLIILDEPFNQLDEQTGLILIKNLKKYYQNKTLIIIKHEKPVGLDDWKEYHIDSNGLISLVN